MHSLLISPRAKLDDEFVAFAGWSAGTAQLRATTAIYAQGGKTSVLFLGPAGVGKRTMAGVWQQVAKYNGFRADGPELPIVDLDSKGVSIPQICIAFTERPLPKTLKCLNLQTGVSRAYTQRRSMMDPLDEGVANRFPLRLYMPPLCERPADILALLYFLNRFILPNDLRRTYESIDEELLDRILSTSWPANARGIRDFLTTSANRDIARLLHMEPPVPAKLGTLGVEQSLDADLPRRRLRHRQSKRTLILEAIDKGRLPNTDAWRAHANRSVRFPKSQDGAHRRSIRFEELAETAIRLYCEECFRRLTPSWIIRDPVHFTADCFREIAIERFVEIGMSGIDILDGDKRVTPSAADLETGCKFVKSAVMFGTTFPALQDGLALNQADVHGMTLSQSRPQAIVELQAKGIIGMQSEKRKVKSHSRPATCVLHIDRWSKLAIGIHTTATRGIEYYAFSPIPESDKNVPIKEGKRLHLPGKRWQAVLNCCAESSDGRTALKKDLLWRMNYLSRAELNRLVPKRRFDADDDTENDRPSFEDKLRVEFGAARQKLRDAMSDLRRELRALIHCDHDGGTLFQSGPVDYQAGFTVRFIVEKDGCLRFQS